VTPDKSEKPNHLHFNQISGRIAIRGSSSMTCYGSKLLVAFVAISCFACETQAAPDITQAVSTECRWDYHNFCSEYGIGSPLLNYCFRNNGAKLSKACVGALIQAGDVSKSYVQQRRKQGH